MSEDGHAATPNETGDPDTGHIVSAATLIATCVALLILTWLTVAVSWYDLGAMNVVIALGLAFTKATVVALYFMHLRWDRPFNRIVIVSALLFVVLLIGLCVMDTQEYRFDVDQGDSPLVLEKTAEQAAP